MTSPISKLPPSALLPSTRMTVAGVLEALLVTNEQERVDHVKDLKNSYNGRDIEFEGVEGPLPYYNICYATVEKGISWFTRIPPVITSVSGNQAVVGEIVSEIIENSGGELFWSQSARMGSVTGDCILQLVYDPDVNNGGGGPAIRVLDSQKTFAEYSNSGNSLKLNRVMLIWEYLDDEGSVQEVIEIWTDKTVTVFPASEVKSVPNFQLVDTNGNPTGTMFTESKIKDAMFKDDEATIYTHRFGELPFVHIPNIKSISSPYGRSDIEDIAPISREMTDALLSYKENVDYHSNPITIAQGVAMSSVDKSADKIWSNVPKEAKIFNLEVTQTHEAILEYLKLLEDGYGYVGIPKRLLMANDLLGSDTSAVAMKLAFLPLTEFITRKYPTYSIGYKEIFEKGIRFTSMLYGLGLESLNTPDEKLADRLAVLVKSGKMTQEQAAKLLAIRTVPYYRIDLKFQDHIPRNRTAELTDITLELQNGLETIPGALKRLGIADIEDKLDEIMDNAEFQYILAQLTQGAKDQEEPGEMEDDNEPLDGITDKELDTGAVTETPNNVEERTGQSAERTATQRMTKGKGDV